MEFSRETEEQIVDFLRKRNIDRVNTNSADVRVRQSVYTKYIKRVLDIIISIPAIIITLPINVVVGVGVCISIGRPVVFKQQRAGKDGKGFMLYKFRSLKEPEDKHGNKRTIDERMTPFGMFIRKTSLDEFLNFFNILKGDMSIIGPRPLLYANTYIYSKRHMMRHAVRPGLECPRLLKREEGMTDYQYQLECDIWYVENCSFATDVKLVFRLFSMLLDRKKRTRNAEVVAAFAGYDNDGNAINLAEAVERYPELEKYKYKSRRRWF